MSKFQPENHPGWKNKKVIVPWCKHCDSEMFLLQEFKVLPSGKEVNAAKRRCKCSIWDVKGELYLRERYIHE